MYSKGEEGYWGWDRSFVCIACGKICELKFSGNHLGRCTDCWLMFIALPPKEDVPPKVTEEEHLK